MAQGKGIERGEESSEEQQEKCSMETLELECKRANWRLGRWLAIDLPVNGPREAHLPVVRQVVSVHQGERCETNGREAIESTGTCTGKVVN